jgi:hypothetical protein
MHSHQHPTKNQTLLFYWLAIALMLVIADFFSGPFIQFPITFLIPVALASWYNGRWWGLGFAVVLPLIRFSFNITVWTVPWTAVEAGFNALIRIVVLSSFALIVDRTATQTKLLSKQVKLLEGLLPICSFCKKIRDENNEWKLVERYIMERTSATFTHGVCPECQQKHYGDILKDVK